MLDKKEFVRQQLSKVPNAKVGINTAMICCPFHSDRTPSCAVFYKSTDRDPGRYYCFSCGAKGDWNTLANALSLEEYNSKPKDEYSTPIVFHEKLENNSFTPDNLIIKDLPSNKFWRKISTNLLIDIGAKACNVVYENAISEKFVYLPVYVDKVLRGYTKGRLKKIEGITSYINAKGSWVKEWGLFPFDYSIDLMRKINSKTIVLVEGQRDALRLLKYGIPAMCIMGTHNWTDKKRWLLELHGVENIILMMDGDDAGILATNNIYPTLKDMFNTRVIKLWKIKGSPYYKVCDSETPSKLAKELNIDLWDPGNCPKHILDKIKKLL